jgi:hypothetical protein
VLANEFDGAVDVARGLRMKRDVGGPRCGEVGHDAVNRLDHEVHVDGRRDPVLAQCRADERPDREVRHVMIVHHIKVHEVRASGEHGVDLLP